MDISSTRRINSDKIWQSFSCNKNQIENSLNDRSNWAQIDGLQDSNKQFNKLKK